VAMAGVKLAVAATAKLVAHPRRRLDKTTPPPPPPPTPLRPRREYTAARTLRGDAADANVHHHQSTTIASKIGGGRPRAVRSDLADRAVPRRRRARQEGRPAGWRNHREADRYGT
jgi:hypothetical protein